MSAYQPTIIDNTDPIYLSFVAVDEHGVVALVQYGIKRGHDTVFWDIYKWFLRRGERMRMPSDCERLFMKIPRSPCYRGRQIAAV